MANEMPVIPLAFYSSNDLIKIKDNHLLLIDKGCGYYKEYLRLKNDFNMK